MKKKIAGSLIPDYLTDPRHIYSASFAACERKLEDHNVSGLERHILKRVVHTTGDTTLLENLKISKALPDATQRSLDSKRPIFCDVKMVCVGVDQSFNPRCYIDHDEVIEKARARSLTRSMVAVEHWESDLKDSICLIGCAPTALFRLLEMIEKGADKPAVIVGTPVGFVGAKEASQSLCDIAEQEKIAYVSLLGHFGGSAIAAAIGNSLIKWYQSLKSGVRCAEEGLL